MFLINPYRFAAPQPQLLDLYPGAAAAYSLRQLRAAHTSAVVRVRRSSDNAEQDFTAAQVTNGSLASFCGAGNGFVRTWHDQSGNNRHAEQSSASLQPQIVSSGSVLLSGGKPCLTLNGSQYLQRVGGGFNIVNMGVFLLFNQSSDLNGRGVFCIYPSSDNDYDSDTAVVVETGGTSNRLIFAGGTGVTLEVTAPGTGATPRAIYSALKSSSRGDIYSNSTLSASDTTVNSFGSSAGAGILIGARYYSSAVRTPLNGEIQEAVFYASDVYSSRQQIEGNLNAHYSIF